MKPRYKLTHDDALLGDIPAEEQFEKAKAGASAFLRKIRFREFTQPKRLSPSRRNVLFLAWGDDHAEIAARFGGTDTLSWYVWEEGATPELVKGECVGLDSIVPGHPLLAALERHFRRQEEPVAPAAPAGERAQVPRGSEAPSTAPAVAMARGMDRLAALGFPADGLAALEDYRRRLMEAAG